ncbi:MAG: phosphatidylglycerol lysyltransferase domain-containing protein [Firmicutes bacterium]|nr:phosphatidylglycerol lysyltransferase domain-containing protein [Bacillota bacterium]
MKNLDFKNFNIDAKGIYEKYASATQGFLGWEYSFAMTFLWNALFKKTKICDAGDFALIYTEYNNKTVFYPPLLKNADLLTEAVKRIEGLCADFGCALDLRGLTQEQTAQLSPDAYAFSSCRNDSDYIYLASDLIGLSGKKFHAKRNFVSRFVQKYDYGFRVYAPSDREGVLNLYNAWRNGGHENAGSEEKVLLCALDNYRSLNLDIGVLTVSGKIAAFNISCAENPLLAHTFFEKADTSFDGAYQAVNQFSARMFFKNVQYVNRQEDMGIEGLRKAKLSYHPAIILDKYRVKRK